MGIARASNILRPSKRNLGLLLLALAIAYIAVAIYLRSTEDEAEAQDWVGAICAAWQERDAVLAALPGWSTRPTGLARTSDRAAFEAIWPAWVDADESVVRALRGLDIPDAGEALRESLLRYAATQASAQRQAFSDRTRLFADAKALLDWQHGTQGAMDIAFAEVAAALNAIERTQRLEFSIRPDCFGLRVFAVSPGYAATYGTEVSLAIQSLALDSRGDWPATRRRFQDAAGRARTPADLYPLVRDLLSSLEDGHSFFLRPDEWIAPATSQAAGQPRAFSFDRVGYLHLPTVRGDAPVLRRYVNTGQTEIARIDAATPCGWIVDLRGSDSGNLYAFIGAVGPLWGEGDMGAFVTGRDHEAWGYEAGAAVFDGQTVFAATQPYALAALPPVAVLTDAATRGAAELIARTFQDRPATRVLGQATAGERVGNTIRQFQDGSSISIQQFALASADGQPYDLPVVPAEIIAGDSPAGVIDQPALARDPGVRAASAWLLAQPACSG